MSLQICLDNTLFKSFLIGSFFIFIMTNCYALHTPSPPPVESDSTAPSYVANEPAHDTEKDFGISAHIFYRIITVISAAVHQHITDVEASIPDTEEHYYFQKKALNWAAFLYKGDILAALTADPSLSEVLSHWMLRTSTLCYGVTHASILFYFISTKQYTQLVILSTLVVANFIFGIKRCIYRKAWLDLSGQLSTLASLFTVYMGVHRRFQRIVHAGADADNIELQPRQPA